LSLNLKKSDNLGVNLQDLQDLQVMKVVQVMQELN